MRDKIMEAMRQRDCILGVVPDHGGMWLSSLRNDGNSPWPSPVPADSVTDGMAESERVQLLTKTNVRTDRGVFEAADTSKTATIATQLTGTPETFLVFGDDGGLLGGAALPGGVFTIPAGTKIRSMIGFNRTLTTEEIAALVEPKKWILPVSDGNLHIRTAGLTNAEWLLPSGEKLHSNIINQNVTAGNVIFSYTGITVGTGSIIMYNSTAIQSEFSAAQLPRVDYYLYLTNQSKLTGDVADLPRVSHQLFLQNLGLLSGDVSGLPDVSTQLYLRNIPNLSGNVANLPRSTGSLTLYALHNITGETSDLPGDVNNLTLADLPGITGSAAAIPSNSGYIRNVYNLAAITGALTVSAANTDVRFYNNSAVTAAEYDETITNVVAAGAQNGTLVISKSRTSASDENIEILRNRGWTVTEQ